MKISIGKKTAVLIASIVIVVSSIAFIAFRYITNQLIEQVYYERSVDLARTAAVAVDGDQVEILRDAVMDIFFATEDPVSSEDWGSDAFYAYLSRYEGIDQMPEFIEIREDLRKVLYANHVESVYISYFNKNTNGTIYLVDAGEEDACPPGCFDPFFTTNLAVLDDPTIGIEPTISNTEEYGWLIATGMPIYNSAGEVVAFAAVDMSMDEIAAFRNQFYLMMGLVLIGVTIVICLLGILIVRRFIVKPINVLSETSVQYCAESGIGAGGTTRHKFADLDIRTGDELEVLANSMKQMENDINEHIRNLLTTKQKLESTREQAQEMSFLANVDVLTGVRNKRAFESEEHRLNQMINAGNTSFGIAMIDLNDLKVINDCCGHDKGDIAIKKLCQLVCNTFKHSPVFRIGGDEFIAVLKRQDFENRDELIASFRGSIDEIRGQEGEIWEQISAALGFAVFDPTLDTQVDTIWKRADADMYENKKRMKSGMVR